MDDAMIRAALDAAEREPTTAAKIAAFLRVGPELWYYPGGLRQINGALADAVEAAAQEAA